MPPQYLFIFYKTMKFFALASIAAVSAVTIRGDFFEARDNGTGPLDKKYERVLPVQFADASADLLGTHKKMSAAEVKEYLNTYFPRTWAHFDVNKVGFIGVEVMPQFVRFLASDQQLS